MNYDEMIAWLSEHAAECISTAGDAAFVGMLQEERRWREQAAMLITAENMLRFHAHVSRD